MSRCLVIMAICKALLLILSDAKVVHVGQKDNPQATEHQFLADYSSVIRLGFEPKTPTLKVLCSTD